MASVVYHSYEQIKNSGKVKLFKSYKFKYKDGEQKRDFIYVKDVVGILLYFLTNKKINGIFNVGSGKARTFVELTNAVFSSLGKKPLIEFIEMPSELKLRYQYETQAEMTKLKKAGYNTPFYSLEDGIKDYVLNYLVKRDAKS